MLGKDQIAGQKVEKAFAKLDELGTPVGTDLRSLRARGLRGAVNAMAGRNIEARKALAELHQLSGPPGFKTAFECASIHAMLGEYAEAFEWLDRAREGRFASLFLVKLRKEFEPMHEDERFRNLLRKMGLPE